MATKYIEISVTTFVALISILVVPLTITHPYTMFALKGSLRILKLMKQMGQARR